MNYDVAIVIVTHNKIFDSCLLSLKNILSTTKLNTAVVIVDNASTEFSAHEKFHEHLPNSIVILRNKNYGFGSSCNRAVQEVSF